ncbi:MAG: hypothetical protein GF364_18600 [Candidatus Lokiarchaeota archaeon]|nr:hypothetical protein [Candidatus Lokiarchaeota archaeon]
MRDEKKYEHKYIYKYPWLEGGREIFEKDNESAQIPTTQLEMKRKFVRLFSQKFEDYPQLYQKIIQAIYSALDKREEGMVISEEEFNIVFFYVIKTILAVYNNRFLDNHVANFISKIYYKDMSSHKRNYREIYKIANYMGLKCQYNEANPKKIRNTIYHYSINFDSYIPAASLLKDNFWAVINRFMENGVVYLFKDDVIRLLQEKIRREVIPQRLGNMDELREIVEKVSDMKEILKKIDDKMQLIKIKLREKREKQGYTLLDDEVKPGYEEYPPCIKVILDKASNGENLVHTERLHIAFYFANTNHSVEETVDVFRTVPDFDEKIARYNVEFSRGLKGKGKKYSVYNCNTLKSEHLCTADDPKFGDPICSKGVKKKGKKYFIKNPLEFSFWYRVRKSKEKRKSKRHNSGDEK